MAEFDVAQALEESNKRHARLLSGEKFVPLSAAIIAVLASLATLSASHSSIAALAQKNQAILDQARASDQYNYYESKRIKVQLNQALINAGAARDAAARKRLQNAISAESAPTKRIYNAARQDELSAEQHAVQSERYMRTYESHEIAAALFQIAIVLVSITALSRKGNLLFVAGAAVLFGLAFFAAGLLR